MRKELLENKGLVTDKGFYKSLLAIAIPIALQNVISFGVQMLDTVMVGSLGDVPLSAVSLANQFFFVFMVFGFGIASGGAVLISQYWGKGNVDAVRRIMGISLRCIVIVSILFMLAGSAFPKEILRIFSKDEVVVAMGADYLKLVIFSYLFSGVASCYLNTLRGTENVKLSTFVYLVSFFVNGFFNYCFIFGKFGFPEMGAAGAAVGTIIARVSEFAIVMVYGNFIEKKVGFRIKHFFKTERELFPDFIRHSLPVIGSELIWSLGAVTQTAIIGNLSTSFVAANSISGVLQQLAMVMMFGIGNAAAVLMGKTVGAGEYEKAKKMGRTFLLLALGVGIISAGLILVLRNPMLSIYRDVTPETKALAFEIMGVMACLMVGTAVEITSIGGILRGSGDTNVAFAIDAGCTWGVGVTMGYLAGYVWHFPLILVFVCLRTDMLVRIVLCLIRILRGKYIKNVTREL